MHQTSVIGSATAATLLLLLGACTVVPPHGFPPSDEREVIVSYDFGDGAPSVVEVPASGPGLTVIWLETDPRDVHESFDSGERQFHPDGDTLEIRCHYRVYQRRDSDGKSVPPSSPDELFPEASSIRTIWRLGEAGGTQSMPAPPAARD